MPRHIIVKRPNIEELNSPIRITKLHEKLGQSTFFASTFSKLIFITFSACQNHQLN